MQNILGVALLTLLGACGGGSNTGFVQSSPIPVAGPTARQIPVNTSLAAQAETVNTVASTARFDLSSAAKVSNVTSTQGPISTAVTIAYDPVGQSYTISTARGGIGNRSTFTAADLRPAAAGIANYQTANAQLLITRPSTLTYSALGAWTDGAAGGTIQSSFFAFGDETALTALTALPKTGTASYALAVAGIGRNGSDAFGLGGGGTATVDFAASRLTAVFNVGLYPGTTTPTSTQVLIGTATIASDFARFSGTLQGSFLGSPVTGPMDGVFFGPAGEEIGGSFKISGGGVEAVGAFVGAN